LLEDRRLVDAISRGDAEAWQQFLVRYAGMIHDVVRRHLFAEDEDEVRTLYVDVLKRLFDGDISKYQNRSLLSSWLAVYTRARSFDYLRSKNGRYRIPKEVEKLSEFDRRVLRLYFVERLGLEIVVHTLAWEGYRIGPEEVVSAIQRIEDRLDRRYLKRLEHEAQASAAGISSVRLLKYLVSLRAIMERDAAEAAPDYILMEKEAWEKADRVRRLVAELPRNDQKLLQLRFDRKMSASEISSALNMKRARQVYSALDRILKKLRVTLAAEESDRP
jgi:RNA polymerase sigma factor (sigma-70 family)